jgi:hypothetical protein
METPTANLQDARGRCTSLSFQEFQLKVSTDLVRADVASYIDLSPPPEHLDEQANQSPWSLWAMIEHFAC